MFDPQRHTPIAGDPTKATHFAWMARHVNQEAFGVHMEHMVVAIMHKRGGKPRTKQEALRAGILWQRKNPTERCFYARNEIITSQEIIDAQAPFRKKELSKAKRINRIHKLFERITKDVEELRAEVSTLYPNMPEEMGNVLTGAVIEFKSDVEKEMKA